MRALCLMLCALALSTVGCLAGADYPENDDIRSFGAPLAPRIEYYAYCRKLHGEEQGWESARVSSRADAQQLADDHNTAFAGHNAKTKRD